ncbi:MAG: 2-amino-4-hydroxy-6-hydroxymethyldihydropteridine diphosphokinase [Erythrobacter sp.]|uniref:2-amino-4-hydroxy-6- hydroxymethyldihydropteridine diphosphokinase n=1 Tax=Erythrobacter sp. TaxID=1042 RepID=UPI002631643B|nr:2-amino-4-hydroxy-6-hydroxymethyldihydropteridine diphosphokinase [Erythrobacter sp.]MDJ0979062.1 2-amino-4-hydroxy-6-hydroxymethyldihydropteridine diphosphokinase [Erythrobacter sp.]
MSETYLIALGSNMRVASLGGPRRVLAAALEALQAEDRVEVVTAAPVVESDPVGPSLRRYANGAAVVESALDPTDMLQVLHAVERQFGRTRAQRRGQRWRARALDLDIILWSGGVWVSRELTIPHREMRSRPFVLGPASAIAARWRDPVTGLSLEQLKARLMSRIRA